jgi:hypothetical protein
MKIDLTIKLLEGDPIDVTARFADFVAFERTWNRSVAKLENDTRLTDIGWLAWHALKRTRQTTLVFDPDWINTVDEVAITTSDGDDFLEEGQSTG